MLIRVICGNKNLRSEFLLVSRRQGIENSFMLITQKIGNLAAFDIRDRTVDSIQIKWYEARKRILIKTTISGTEITMKFLDENPELTEGDILFVDDRTVIAVVIEPCDCIVIRPKTNFEIATACYEIGNKHLPLFFDNDDLLVPFEKPLFNLLQVEGYDVREDNRKLLRPLKTTVSPHTINISEAVFSSAAKQATN